MSSALRSRIQAWCLRPSNLWDCETTTLLVRREWKILRTRFSWNPDNYSTAGYILNTPTFVASKKPISTWANGNQIYLEAPSPNELNSFYIENNLSPVSKDEQHLVTAVGKLDDALKILDSVPSVVDCISQLVRVIGILKASSLEEDVSYSHPEIPFSIFVSICDKPSFDASARVAESILHEAMHLRLSLIQKEVKLLASGRRDRAQCFSPWRQEERPANGVLHGIFVFRAILDFFQRLSSKDHGDQIADYSDRRIKEISSQLAQVRDFCKSPALTATGAELARQLVHA